MNNRISFKQRMNICIFLGVIFLFFLLGFLTYDSVSNLLVNQSKQNSQSLAETVGKEIDGDAFAAIASVESDEYHEVYNILKKYRGYAMVKYIYAMKLDGEKLVFVVDTDEEDPAGFLEEYSMEPDMLTAFNGQVSCDYKVTHDRWGSYYSAYSPIFSQDGQVQGIVGIDVSVDSIEAYLLELRRIIAIMLTVMAIIVISIFVITSIVSMGRDDLTELYNYERFTQKGIQLQRLKTLSQYDVIMINIRDFKYLNKKYGYDVGNEVLYRLGSYLKNTIKGKKIIARNGNDNYVLLVSKAFRDKTLESISEPQVEVEYNKEITNLNILIRIGVYEIQAEDKFNEAMERCSVAITNARAKASGVPVFFAEEMYSRIDRESEILALYKRGIKDNEFRAYYQPKVNPKTKKLSGAEALVRWFHEGNMISPGEFIPVIEKEGLVTELDYHVLHLVCRDIKRWLEQNMEVVRISTNFSKMHLRESDFAERVLGIIDSYGIDHKYLNVELTESSGYVDYEALKSFLEKMKEAGIYVSMDDFGTGYSSLSMLGDLEWDEVKIDKSLVDMIEVSKEKATMVKNIIRIIYDLNHGIICEGVETKAQLDFLSETECGMIQGYYFDKPLSKEEFEQRLNSSVYEK